MTRTMLFTGIAEHKAYLLDKQFENYAKVEGIDEVWYYVNNSDEGFVERVRDKCKDFGFFMHDMGMINPSNSRTSNSRPYAKCLDHFYEYARKKTDADYIVINGGDNLLQKDHIALLEHFDKPKVGLVAGMCFIRLDGEVYPHTVANLGGSGLHAVSKEGLEPARKGYIEPQNIPKENIFIWGKKYVTVPMMSFSTDDVTDFTRLNDDAMVMTNGYAVHRKTIFNDCITIPSPGMIIPRRFFVIKNNSNPWFSMDIFLERKVYDLDYSLVCDSNIFTSHWLENGCEVR